MTTIKQKASSLSTFSNLHLHSKSTTITSIYPFFAKPSKESVKKTQSSKGKQYKANPELAKLLHSIYKGEKINAKIPPENITYEMLENEVGDIDLILHNSQKSKEELRIDLWNMWYKIIAGYKKYDTKGLQNKKIGGFTKYTNEELGDLLDDIEESIYKTFPLSQKKDEANFMFALLDPERRRKVIDSLNIKKELDEMTDEDIQELIKTCTITYPYGNKITELYKPDNNLHMYGMQLPHQFDRLKLLNTIFYLFNNKNIYNIVDLHDCANATNREHPLMADGIGCNPYDRNCEYETWALAEKIQKIIDPSFKSKFYSVIGYEDMYPGHLSAWETISTIDDVSVSLNSVVIHCYAGAGRTGSVMLYLLLRDLPKNNTQVKNLKERFAQPHFGFKNIIEVIKGLIKMFGNRIGNIDVSFMLRELFKISELLGASLLRQRINRIFFFLARHFTVETFYTYERPSMVVVNLPDDEFSKPVLHTIDWASFDSGNFNKDSILPWLN
jgi:hypothetical protein